MTEINQQKLSLPEPGEFSAQERSEAVNSYIMMLASWLFSLPLPFVGLLTGIIYYVLHKNESNFVSFHSLQALLALVPVTLINAGWIFWILFLFLNSFENLNSFLVYAGFAFIINILYMFFSIKAALRARKGFYFFFMLRASTVDRINAKTDTRLEIELPGNDEYRMS